MRLFALVCSLVVALAFIVSSASAQVIHACAKDKSGTMRLVTDPADCNSRETLISWNQVGPQGETGPAGEPGETGPEGPSGAGLVAIDANGEIVGTVVEWLGDPLSRLTTADASIYIEELRSVARVSKETGETILWAQLVDFSERNCLGQPYVREPSELVTVNGRMRYFRAVEGAASEFPALLSRLDNNGACINISGTEWPQIPAVEVSAEALGIFPLAVPLYVAPSP